MVCPDCGGYRHQGPCTLATANAGHARPAMPSRQFLVTQAILNAAAEMFPVSAKAGLLTRALEMYDKPITHPDCWPCGSMLFKDVPRHFRKLVASYGGTTCPST